MVFLKRRNNYNHTVIEIIKGGDYNEYTS